MTLSDVSGIGVQELIDIYIEEKGDFPCSNNTDQELNAMGWLLNDLLGAFLHSYYPYAECTNDLNVNDKKDFKEKTAWMFCKDDILARKKMLLDNQELIGKPIIFLLYKLTKRFG